MDIIIRELVEIIRENEIIKSELCVLMRETRNIQMNRINNMNIAKENNDKIEYILNNIYSIGMKRKRD